MDVREFIEMVERQADEELAHMLKQCSVIRTRLVAAPTVELADGRKATFPVYERCDTGADVPGGGAA
jgi:hypothetical protein